MNAHSPLPISLHLEWAHPLVRDWFVGRFGTPTEPQQLGWPSILAGETTLISAPTGSGKTLAAFLICIDRLVRKALNGELTDQTEVLYVSPLKALSNDIQKNLEVPLGEILQLAGQRGILMPDIRTGVRTGDTLAHERRAMLVRPPHILVTTPESLYILLTAVKSREVLRTVETVIVDEIHAVADDKRGAHLALSLERLDHLAGKPLTRIGLSATQKPIELGPTPSLRKSATGGNSIWQLKFREASSAASRPTKCGTKSTIVSRHLPRSTAPRLFLSTRAALPSA
jgi:ATP-dependent Lhr-like helicase